jgi:hypothetical protein
MALTALFIYITATESGDIVRAACPFARALHATRVVKH